MAKFAPDDRAQLHKDANQALDDHLAPGETVKVIIRGSSSSAIIGTDRRVFVFKKGIFNRELATFEYKETSGVILQTGLVLGYAALQGPGLAAVDGADKTSKAPHAISINEKGQAQENVPLLRALISERQAAAAAPAAPGGDVTDQLRKLGELRDSGILTDAEFDSKKAELLARL